MSLYVVFTNDGKGTQESSNYTVRTYINDKKIWQGRVEGHDRSNGWMVLLQKFLTDGRGESCE